MKPKKIGTVETVDAESGQVIEVKRNAMTMLPPQGDVCQACAVKHDHDQPHNQQSLYWQYHFYSMHDRWPTWTDAMAHCTPEVKTHWRRELPIVMKAAGVKVPADLLDDNSFDAGGR